MKFSKETLGGLALFSIALMPAAPAIAQDAPLSDEDTQAAYAMTMMCLESTMSMAIKAQQDGDTAAYDKMKNDGALWLGVAESFAADLGRSADADMDGSIGRILGEGNLLGDDVAFARQKQVFDACDKIINPPAK